MLEQQVGFVGAGQIARALAKGMVAAQLVSGSQVTFYDPSSEARAEFARAVRQSRPMPSNSAVAAACQVLVLAVKPQQVGGAAVELAGRLTPQQLVVSVAAGVPLAELQSRLGTSRLVRVMPNTPCLVGQGAAAFAAGSGATADDVILVDQMLSAVGIAERLDESLLDVVTGLSGSGPAFVYLIIEALSDGAVRMGLTRETAIRLATQTVLGAAMMVRETGEHPAVLKDRVASPGGTTLAGLMALERGGVRGALMQAVEAATRRSRELGHGPERPAAPQPTIS